MGKSNLLPVPYWYKAAIRFNRMGPCARMWTPFFSVKLVEQFHSTLLRSK